MNCQDFCIFLIEDVYEHEYTGMALIDGKIVSTDGTVALLCQEMLIMLHE